MSEEKICFGLSKVSVDVFRKKMGEEDLNRYGRIILTGAGQCFAAALAAVPAFKALYGGDIRGCHTQEMLSGLPKDVEGALVVILCDSTEAGQETACAGFANENGAYTLAVSVNRDNGAAKVCRKIMCVPELASEPLEQRPAVHSAMIQILFYLAMDMGLKKGNITEKQAERYGNEIRAYIEEVNRWLVEQYEDICINAKKWAALEDFESIGLGEGYISALLCANELMLENKCMCSCENMEEWCHLNFFIREHEKVGTLIFVDASNKGMMRIQEAVYVIHRMKRQSVLFTDGNPDVFVSGMKVYRIPAPAQSWISPAGMFAPGVLFVYCLAAWKRGM